MLAQQRQQKRRRNHWVPQSYLRFFAAAPVEKEKIWRFSKTVGDYELKPIKKVAVKNYLYAPKGPDGRDYRFEEKLGSLEQLFGLRSWAATCTDFVDLCDPTIRKCAAVLAAVMYLRNPLRLAMTHALHKSLVDYYLQLPQLPDEIEMAGRTYKLDHSDWASYRDAGEEDVKRMWIDQVRTAGWLAETLIKMRWEMRCLEKPGFITTDNPVAVLHPTLGFHGFKDPETSVFYPLSPTRLLIMHNRQSRPDGAYYSMDDEGPGGMNGLLWRESIDHMFSSRNPDYVLLEMDQDARRHGY